MKDIIKPVAVLACICLVVTAMLAYVNLITQPVIREAEEKEAERARSEVLSQAESFEKLIIPDLPEGVTDVFRDSGGCGYVIMMNQKGYGGTIRMICGIRSDGTLEAVKTLSHSETSGIGSRVVDNSSGYRDRFSGKTKENFGEVDAVSGATISSKAYKKAVASAFEAYETAKEAE